MIEAKIIEDSVAPNGKRLTTLQLTYPRLFHSEVLTHRVFSRNASSSRAIPIEKMIQRVRENPAMPIHWGKAQSGMQAFEEVEDAIKIQAQRFWLMAAESACEYAEYLRKLGLAKQVVNRVTEPYQHITVVFTGTEFDNFFELRCHPDAQPEFQELANQIKGAMQNSEPVMRRAGGATADSWHLPYITDQERHQYFNEPLFLAQLSAARCARVSYLNHDGTEPNVLLDKKLYLRLVGSKPLHASPVEHQAYPLQSAHLWSRNFNGWCQHRELVEKSFYA